VVNNFLDPIQASYPILQGRKFVLGSQSPRRKALLEGLGIRPEIRTNDMDETIPDHILPHQAPEYLAKKKSEYFLAALNHDELLITADTIVIINQTVLGKPADKKEAMQTLKVLSAAMHEVVSGVCISSKIKQHSFSEITKVFFRSLSEEQINYYVDQFAPYDKAGGYGIQEWIGLIGIEKIEGDFYNVMGLPVGRLAAELEQHFAL
jgi:septum formation protein